MNFKATAGTHFFLVYMIRKSEEISENVSWRIMEQQKSGSSSVTIFRCLNVPRSSVQAIIHKYRHDGNVQPSYS